LAECAVNEQPGSVEHVRSSCRAGRPTVPELREKVAALTGSPPTSENSRRAVRPATARIVINFDRVAAVGRV